MHKGACRIFGCQLHAMAMSQGVDEHADSGGHTPSSGMVGGRARCSGRLGPVAPFSSFSFALCSSCAANTSQQGQVVLCLRHTDF